MLLRKMATDIISVANNEETLENDNADLPNRMERIRLLPPGPETTPAILQEQVFGLEMVREKILLHAISTGTEICEKTLCSLRLVNKNWCESISRLLFQRMLPLYRIKACKDSMERFDSFLIFLSELESKGLVVDLVKVYFEENFFCKENYDRFYAIFVEFGARIVDLHIVVSDGGIPFPWIFPSLSLPVLKRFRVKGYFDFEDPLHSINTMYMIQSVLNEAKTLNSFHLEGFSEGLPGFEYLTIQPTVKSITLYFDVLQPALNLIERSKNNHFEHLHLKFLRSSKQLHCMSDNFWNILKRCKSSLTSLSVEALVRCQVIKSKIFPILPSIKKIHLNNVELELEGELVCMHEYFPMVSSLELKEFTHAGLTKWIKDSIFPNVATVDLTINHTELEKNSRDTMHLLAKAFPNINNFSLRILQYKESKMSLLFMEMRTLKKLSIWIGIKNSDDFKQECWDSWLTGLPRGLIVPLSEHPKVWKNLQVYEDSIMNLEELETLEFDCKMGRGPCTPMISDVVFHLCLLRMRNLRHLSIGGDFQMSDEMEKEWKSLGRTLSNKH